MAVKTADTMLPVYFELMEQGLADYKSASDHPKLVYYSTTRRALYVMYSSWNTAPYFEVAFMRRETGVNMEGLQVDGFNVQKYRLKTEQYKGMNDQFERFQKFLNLHINHKVTTDEFQALIYDPPVVV